MTDSTRVVLKGVVTRLRAYGALTTLTTPSTDLRSEKGIFSSILQQTPPPYVLIEIDSSPWDQDDDANMRHALRVHAYNNEQSPNKCMQILEEVYNALNRQEANIALDSGTVVLCVFQGLKTVFKETDGNTWHGVIEFNLIID